MNETIESVSSCFMHQMPLYMISCTEIGECGIYIDIERHLYIFQDRKTTGKIMVTASRRQEDSTILVFRKVKQRKTLFMYYRY